MIESHPLKLLKTDRRIYMRHPVHKRKSLVLREEGGDRRMGMELLGEYAVQAERAFGVRKEVGWARKGKLY